MSFRRLPTPTSIDELLDRASLIAGRSLSSLAWELCAAVPDDLRHHKGWVGQLIEAALGAPGGRCTRPRPRRLFCLSRNFTHLAAA